MLPDFSLINRIEQQVKYEFKRHTSSAAFENGSISEESEINISNDEMQQLSTH
jgi:hypothetical protein